MNKIILTILVLINVVALFFIIDPGNHITDLDVAWFPFFVLFAFNFVTIRERKRIENLFNR